MRRLAFLSDIITIKTVYLILLVKWNSLGSRNVGLHQREFCPYETMDIKCDPDEVVIVEEAINGRMADGRCISSEHGFIGCQKDVLDLVDLRCSGRRLCKIELPDKELDLATPCPRDLMRYLIVAYRCLKVFTPPRAGCVGNYLVPVPLPFGSLSSLTTFETKCGSTDIAWLIDAREGQTVVITLLDFGSKNGSTRVFPTAFGHSSPDRRSGRDFGDAGMALAASTASHCYVYGLLKQRRTGHTSKICGGLARVDSSYRFSDTAVEIRILPGHLDRLRYFVIKYEVTGCADVDWLLPGSSIERNGNITVMRCSTSDSSWRFVCDGTQWKGEKPDCLSIANEISNEGSYANGEDANRDATSFSRATSLVTMTAIAAFIGILIFIVGLCCFARCRRRDLRNKNAFGGANRNAPPDESHSRLKDTLQYEITHPAILCPEAAVSFRGVHAGPLPILYRMDAENDYESMEHGSGGGGGGGVSGATGLLSDNCNHRTDGGGALLPPHLQSSCPSSTTGPDIVVHRVQSQILTKNSYFGNAF